MPLSNADFRAIFHSSTGPKAHEEDSYDRQSSNKRKDKPDFQDKGSKPKKFKAPNPKKVQTEEEKKAEETYRDRAKERRVGQNVDYTISEDAVKGLSVEESKYLGGDMQHTHLVKGLDFALLAKIRSEMEHQQDEELDASLEAKSGKKEKAAALEASLEIKTSLGQSIKKLCLTDNKNKKGKVEIFLPGKTTFVFDLDDDFGSEMPTTVSRSIDDLNKYQFRDKKTANISKSIMTSISTIMGYIRQGSRPQKKMIKKERKEEKAAPAPKPAVVPDEDIFDDAGTYDLNMRAGADK